MPPARYANTPIIQISNTYHHIGGRAEEIAERQLWDLTIADGVAQQWHKSPVLLLVKVRKLRQNGGSIE